ncbi:hypothetical protein [Kitasatospora sp. NPDC096204]|uniref:hypothetical protein n=1 Tax=Kitasatospora sp. NPDC096204 TaxID=3364094 RepID=UPI0037F6D62B
MRANHATKPQEPAPGGVAGARRGIARWLPRPRAVATAGALLAQLWGFGASAYAATVDPLPDPARSAVRRAPHAAPELDRPALDGPALDGQSAERPVGSGPSAGALPDHSPGPTGRPTGDGPVEDLTGITGATGAVGATLQERIRAGGLPLPGQRAAVPDAFALASGLLDTDAARARPDGPRVSREGGAADLSDPTRRRTDAALPALPGQREATAEPLFQEAVATAADRTGPTAEPDRTADLTAPTAPGRGGPPETTAAVDTATAATSGHGSATATAVLAPIAAGLLLTGAAMCKHRGLPSGH